MASELHLLSLVCPYYQFYCVMEKTCHFTPVSLYRFGLFLMILMVPLPGRAQIPFHVTNYERSVYSAGNQNWAIDLDYAGNLYVGNTNGLLILRGASFSLYEMPLKTPVRSVRFIDGLVYSGSFEDFGYWQKDDAGNLNYHSLVPLLNGVDLKNEEFWRIKQHEGAIYFQSFGKLLRYNGSSIKEIEIPGSVLFLLKGRERLFIQQIDGGLFEIKDDELLFIEGTEIFSDTEVKAILPFTEETFLIGTSSKGVFLSDGTSWVQWSNEADQQLREFKINNGVRLGSLLAFGTIMKGVFIFDLEGKLMHHLHSGNSIQNNTILALRSDAENNLWVGMDKGFDYIALNSPVELYTDPELALGTVYTAALYKGTLYIGTNQGIHYFSLDENGKFSGGRFISESQGQVWFIKEIDGDLYCGLNEGTFIIRNNKLIQVSDVRGGYNLKKLSGIYDDFLIQSTYYPVVVYEKGAGSWRQSHILTGFEGPARFLEVDHLGNIWLGHSLAGVYQLQPSGDLKTAIRAIKMDGAFGLNSPTNRVFKLDNRIVILTGETILQWDAINQKLIPYNDIIPKLEGFEKSNMLIPAGEGKYWFVKDKELGLFEIRFNEVKLVYRFLPEMFGLELVEDYENIVALNDTLHLICLSNGFSILNFNRINQLPENNYPPEIREITFWKNPERNIRFGNDHLATFKPNRGFNNVNIQFSSRGSFGEKKYFQYKLSQIDQDWSEWALTAEVTYLRLPPGSYVFQVRTLGNKGFISQSEDISFKVRAPWYITFYAFAFYALVILLVFWYVRLRYQQRFFKKREDELKRQQNEIIMQKEQAESEIIRLTNEKLQSEISLKNTQLANNTISIIRKNELLNEIQKELSIQKEELGQRVPRRYFERINKLIENSIKSDHDWEMFEKLFDQAHENFFQRLKAEFPELTPGDLRLSAYLRLNLSSKEIAPLLNISLRGVEERRYRLRKRMGLPSNQNLVEFILSF